MRATAKIQQQLSPKIIHHVLPFLFSACIYQVPDAKKSDRGFPGTEAPLRIAQIVRRDSSAATATTYTPCHSMMAASALCCHRTKHASLSCTNPCFLERCLSSTPPSAASSLPSLEKATTTNTQPSNRTYILRGMKSYYSRVSQAHTR